MKLRGRNLSVRMRGEDVALLQSELQQLGFAIRTIEITRHYFGRETRQAVQDFQRNHDLPPTGKVDERTARAINAAVETLQPQSRRFIVRGEIRQQDGRPTPALLVKAFDKDLRSEELLGETTANERGHYEIMYTADQFRRAKKRSADLVVRAFWADGEQAAESETLFNAPPVATVNLVVAPREEPQLSEVERVEAAVDQVREDVQYPDFTDEDITFLARETQIERQHIEFLSQAAKHSLETGLPTKAFYGWARQGLSLDMENLLAQPSERPRTALETAIDEDIIPARLRESLDGIMSRLEQLKFERGFLVAREVIGQLLNEETEEPLAGFTVRAFDLDAEGEQGPRLRHHRPPGAVCGHLHGSGPITLVSRGTGNSRRHTNAPPAHP